MTHVPCIRIEHMTPTQKRSYVIADNRLAEDSTWDRQLLALEFEDLGKLDPDFDLTQTGFEEPEIDALFDELATGEHRNPKDDLIPESAPPRCKEGDLWKCGDSLVLCADARNATALDALMGSQRAHMTFTDPPYNVRIAGNVSGKGAVKHRECRHASGNMSKEEFTGFLRASFDNIARYSVDGAIAFICMDWRHVGELTAAAEGIFSEQKNLIVWTKDNGGMGTFYRSAHELIFVYKVGTAAHMNNFELGQHGRYRTNVWRYAGVNTRKAGRMEELELHPTVKPVEMIADAIKDVTTRGGIVLDLFGGSGSTLISAHKVGRRARIIEIDPIYCDRMLARWEKYAKDEAVLIASGIV